MATLGWTWLGHPLVDMGLGVITVFSELDRPEDLTPEHLERFKTYALDTFFSVAGRKNSIVLFTTNFPATHPSMNAEVKPGKVRALLDLHLEAGRSDAPPCTFCGAPSATYEGKPIGVRDRIPLFPGQEIVNFYPYGRLGIPVCGRCLLCVLALVVGAPLVSGRVMVLEAERPELLLELLRWWLPMLRERIHLSQASGKDPDTLGRPLSNVVHALVQIQDRIPQDHPGDLTVYHLSNSGQGADFQLYRVPSATVGLVAAAQRAALRPAWVLLSRRGRDPKSPDIHPRWTGRNSFYECIAQLPTSFSDLVRRHLIPAAAPGAREPGVRIWPLAEAVLREVMNMESQRVEAARRIADQLAMEIMDSGDRRLLDRLYRARTYSEVRRLLIMASFGSVRRGNAPVASFQDFVSVFEEADDVPRLDWRLSWDLILIRLLDQLAASDWFSRYGAPDLRDDEDSDEEEGA
ncbi:MAG: type I-B CRISPR-associated protein Cas8b1/Cst1 [Chloroflexi bacterium]|nr:type I-B CRISPR-associated protein Cas8b1/Cst1 [Chloroflexota bacterium]